MKKNNRKYNRNNLKSRDADAEMAKEPNQDRIIETTPRREDVVDWSYQSVASRRKAINILEAPSFSARGMQLIYGRGDHFSNCSCGLDMMLRKDGRLFVRFCSPPKRITYRTYELVGMKLPTLPPKGVLLDDDCVPEVLRDLYNDWVLECIWWPDDID